MAGPRSPLGSMPIGAGAIRLLVRVAFVLSTVAVTAGCVGVGEPRASGEENGYLYRNGPEVLFVRLDGGTRATHGALDWYHGKAQRISADFTLLSSEGGFSLQFPDGSLAGWTGTFSDKGISVVIPAPDGALRTLPLTPATAQTFAAAVASLE